MSKDSLAEKLKNPDYKPPLAQAIPLGFQHVLAMFVSNFTPAIIVGLAAGYSFGSPDLVYLIQMSMLFAGIATLFQTIGMGPIGGRLPIMQGTSFAFIPIMIPIVKTAGMAALFGGIVIGGIFHFLLGTVIGKIRNFFPPLVTGLVVLTIGLSLIPVGIDYAAGGVPLKLKGSPEFGGIQHWGLALTVIIVTLVIKFTFKGLLSSAAVLIGLISGYLVAVSFGYVNFSGVGRADWFAIPHPLKYGFEMNVAAIIGMCAMGFVSAIETVGDVSGITKGGAGREATNKEVQGATFADGLGTAIAGLFGGLPNTSFSQNVGLIAITGVMSRFVVTIGAVFLIISGLVPKVGAAVSSMPIAVLGGGIIVMFGMVASAGANMLSDVTWTRRNMIIFATSLSIGLGLKAVPESLQHLPKDISNLFVTGLLPVAVIAIILNIVIPDRD